MATKQLVLFKEKERRFLLQLQKIEKRSLILHQNIRARMKRAGIPEIAVRQQTSELYEMTKEVNGQVENVQARIVQDARNHIIQMYGQGPVKVVQALECSQDSNKME